VCTLLVLRTVNPKRFITITEAPILSAWMNSPACSFIRAVEDNLRQRLHQPFGYKYCYFQKWNWPQKIFIYIFGLVDLPTRIRSIALRKVLKDEKKPKYILDAGCGLGLYSFYLAEKYPSSQIYAYDINERWIEEAEVVRKKIGFDNLHFHTKDLVACEVHDGNKYDLIICIEVLQYCPDNHAVLDHFRKLISDTGRVIVHVPIRQKLLPATKVLLRERNLYNEDSVRSLLIENGFQIEKIVYTFGKYHRWLTETCRTITTRLPLLLVFAYPIFLCLMRFSRSFHESGDYLLAVALPDRRSST